MKKKCVICGMEFEARTKNQKTCSPECSCELLRETRKRNAAKYYERHKTNEDFRKYKAMKAMMYKNKIKD